MTRPATSAASVGVRRLLSERGLTFRDIAARGGPSPATLTRLLQGPGFLKPALQERNDSGGLR